MIKLFVQVNKKMLHLRYALCDFYALEVLRPDRVHPCIVARVVKQHESDFFESGRLRRCVHDCLFDRDVRRVGDRITKYAAADRWKGNGGYLVFCRHCEAICIRASQKRLALRRVRGVIDGSDGMNHVRDSKISR